MTIARGHADLPGRGDSGIPRLTIAALAIPEWQRWNDYGIGLLLKGDKGSEKGELIQADARLRARSRSSAAADGPLNLARVYLQGRPAR